MELKRIRFFKILLALIVAIISLRLFYIQILQHGEWVAKAEEQHTMENSIPAERGEIYAMDGEEAVALVMNTTVYMIVIDPLAVKKEKLEEALKVAGVQPEEGFEGAFGDPSLRYFILAKNVSRDQAEKIREAELSGVYIKEGTKRVYPEGEMAAQVLGFVNADGEGQYGVEGALNTELKGKDGLLKTIADVNQVALSIGNKNVKIPAEDGKDIVLSIDRNIQRGVEKILAEKLEEFNKTNASAIVMNPNTGEILAIANLPTYDPANYGKVESAGAYVDYVTEDAYEPASVCKAFTFATGIELGVMTPETTYYNKGYEVIDGWTIKNAALQESLIGPTTMQKALNWSLNTGSIQALRLIGGNSERITEEGRKTLYDYYHNKFRLGRETGVELYESIGVIGDPVEGDGRDSLYANMTFGQNMQVTMLQVISGYNALVNGGIYYTPTIVKGEMKDEKIVEKEREEGERVISEETSDTIRGMLYGTRESMRLYNIDKEGYYIGGKTGTAQTIRDGKYTMDEWVASYVGFGGREDRLPEYSVMVRIWKEGETTGAEQYALPIFTEISNFMIDYLKLKPSV